MLLKIAIVLLFVWLVGTLGVYDVGDIYHLLLLAGLMLLLLAVVRAREEVVAAARRDDASARK